MPPQSAEEQKQLAAKFREECLAEGIIKPESEAANDEYLLRRFLRARQYDFKASKIMLKNSEDWRASVGGKGMNDLYKELDPFDYPERDTVFEHWPLYFHQTDKLGRPVNIHNFGSINVHELNKHVSPERFTDILTVNCEALTREILPACSVAAGKHIETVLVIVDLKGFGISQFWAMKDMVRQSFQISQDYYPETMGQVAIINAPMTFTTMWSAIKPWLAKETVDKVDILGSNYQEALLRLVDAENLPTSLGGKCQCEGPGGCARSNKGPWLQDRAQRREAWIRGERPVIALAPEDIDKSPADDRKDKAESTVQPEDPQARTALPDDSHTKGTNAAPDAPLEAAVASELPPSCSSTPVTSQQDLASADIQSTQTVPVQSPVSDVHNGSANATAADGIAVRNMQDSTPELETSTGSNPVCHTTETDPGLPRPSAESAVSVEPPSGAMSPTSATSTAHRSRKSKKSLGSIFSGKSRSSSVASRQSAEGAPRKSRIRETVEKVVDKLRS